MSSLENVIISIQSNISSFHNISFCLTLTVRQILKDDLITISNLLPKATHDVNRPRKSSTRNLFYRHKKIMVKPIYS